MATALAPIVEPSELVASIERARALLDAGDVEAALLLSTGVYEQAKAAGGYAQKVKASRELVDKARVLQAEALKIESICYVAMADAVDAAQAKGELARPGRKTNISGDNIFTLEEVGLDAQSVHQARKLRNAERADPGFIDRVVEARLEEGLEPSRASLKQAAGHAIGTKTRTKEERGPDAYFTAPEALPVLLALESFSATVKEPACGAGHISRPLEAAGYEVLISDILDRGTTTRHGELQQVGDFLLTDASGSEGVDIVTNPPYGRHIMNRFIAHALRVHKPRKMALLLNLNAMCGCEDAERLFMMDECPPSRAYVFSRRLPMMHQEGWDGNEAGSQMNVAWFIWERNADGSYGSAPGSFQVMRVDWQAYQAIAPLAPGAGGFVAPLRFDGVDPRTKPEDDDLQRETPRKSLDERVEEERVRALTWVAEQDGFDEAEMRRGLGLRRSTVDALVAGFSEQGFITFFEDRWRITQDGWTALKASSRALVGLAVVDAVDGAGKAVAS
ncbi:hypothetical protein [Rhizobium arsenicireducens]